MRPTLPLLPLQGALSPVRKPVSPRRPPRPSENNQPTWRVELARGTAPRLQPDVIGVALLAAEAKRRGGLMLRERRFVGSAGQAASRAQRARVSCLERDVRDLMRTVARAKARVKSGLRVSPGAHASSPRSVISKR